MNDGEVDYGKEAAWAALLTPITRDEIMQHITEEGWQKLRASLHFTSLEMRFKLLSAWLETAPQAERRAREVQVANYVNALKRGGMIK